MAIEIKPPHSLPENISDGCVFLAGSIDQGTAIDWQSKVISMMKDTPSVILNPRRSTWNSEWKQDITETKFREQVEWELSGLALADVIAVYFAPHSKAPITLLEFGLYAQSGKLVVCCPSGFYRKGNVDIVCQRYGVETVPTIEELAKKLMCRLENRKLK